MKIVNGLLYTKDHEWVKVEGNKAYIGITDYAQKALGDIVFIELPDVDAELEAGDTFGAVESVKAASDLYLPVSGKVVETNESIVDDPQLVNSDAFGSWMIAVEMTNASELEVLISADEYVAHCGEGA